MENQQSRDPRRTDPEKSDGDGGAASGTTVSVTVVRTGGFAGIRREWRAQPPADEAPRWIALIRECPWDAEDAQCPPAQPDRFVWRIDARLAQAEKHGRTVILRHHRIAGDIASEPQIFQKCGAHQRFDDKRRQARQVHHAVLVTG